MRRPPSDRELDQALAKLPREGAPAGFSRRVLADLDGPTRSRAGARWLLAAGAAAALAVGLWLVPLTTPEPPQMDVGALEEEHRHLMAELESLKASLRESETMPVLYLGGNEQLDLVLDLGPIWRPEPAAGMRPAVFTGTERPSARVDPRNGGNRR
jgi:hypothetical protein